MRIISGEDANVDFIEISFKDQYIGRSDMWRLKLSLQNTCAYAGKKISFSCIRVRAQCHQKLTFCC